MNFLFDDDQNMLRDAAKKLLRDKATFESAHQHMDRESDYDKDLWKLMIDNGWLGIAVPEEYGGSGMTYLDLAVVAEELGYYYAHTPFSASIFGAVEAIMTAGTEKQKHEYLPKLVNGDLIGTLALYEKAGRYDVAGISAEVKNGKLNGTKLPVSDGLCADVAVVAAKGTKGLSLYLVDLKQSGVSRSLLKTMEVTRKQATINFENVDAILLGAEGEGESLLEASINRTAILVAFEQLGGAQRSLDMARDYAIERYAFGRQIGSYQAIKHRLADMYVKVEMARSNCFFGAWALTSSADDIAEAAAVSRIGAVDAFAYAAQENVQIHGGIGFTWEADPHLLLKRMKLQEALLGGGGVWKEKLYKVLSSKQAA